MLILLDKVVKLYGKYRVSFEKEWKTFDNTFS